MEDQIAKDKALMLEYVQTNQEAGQAIIDMDKDFSSLILQDRPINSFIHSWYRNLPEILFNPFWNEKPDYTVTLPSDHVMQRNTPHGEQLLRSLLDCLKPGILPPIREDFINVINHQPFLGIMNNALLSFQTKLKGYHDRRWYSRGLIENNKFKIKEQESPVYLCYWSFVLDDKPITFNEAFQCVDRKEEATREISCVGKIYALYNAEQILGISAMKEDAIISYSPNEIAKKCEHIVGGMGVSLAFMQDEAKYDRENDCISLPNNTLSVENHYKTLIDQACYATAHEERLDRNLVQWQEDLCCSLAGMSLCNRLQLDVLPTIKPELAQEWTKNLLANKEDCFSLLQEVKRIIDYMMELCPIDMNKDLSDYDFSQSLQDRINRAKKGW